MPKKTITSTKMPVFQSYPIIKQIMRRFKEKERDVVMMRFGLTNESPKTLDSIGKKYGITRERVRQIEKNALTKFKSDEIFKKLNPSINHVVKIIKNAGGIISEQDLVSSLFPLGKVNNAHLGAYSIYLRLNPEVFKTKPTKSLKSYVATSDAPTKLVEKVAAEYVKVLDAESKVLNLASLLSMLRKTTMYERNKKHLSNKLLVSMLNISDKILKTKNGRYGLKNWPSINPRNTRDKIYYIFKEQKKPLYFRDLTAKIAEKSFVGKAPAAATVHNELISDNRYVLIGKGIYALREWGYSDGTVSDVLTGILKENTKGLAQDKLIEQVLKVRQVNKNTVIMNLQNKKVYVRDSKTNNWKIKTN